MTSTPPKDSGATIDAIEARRLALRAEGLRAIRETPSPFYARINPLPSPTTDDDMPDLMVEPPADGTEPAVCGFCEAGPTLAKCATCRVLSRHFGTPTNRVLVALLGVQMKQANEARVLNEAIRDIITKLSVQAERDIKSMAQNDEFMEMAKKHNAQLDEYKIIINDMMAEMKELKAKVGAAESAK